MTRISWLVVMGLAGCGAKPAEPLASPGHPVEHVGYVVELAAPMPPVDLRRWTPDVSDYGRWPLTVAEHPELEPHFAVADALAEPGLRWQDLCARGVQSRHMSQHAELGEYLGAWCFVINDNPSEALYRLGHVHGGSQLEQAVQLDAAAIVVASFPGAQAESELRRAALLDVRVVDRVAAAYYEISKLDAAAEVNRLAISLDASASLSQRCARALRSLADGSSSYESQLEILARSDRDDDACVTTAKELSCSLGLFCAVRSANERHAHGSAELERAARSWPRDPARYSQWMVVLNAAIDAWPYEQSYRLAVPALELALRTSLCKRDRVEEVRRAASMLKTYGQTDGGVANAVSPALIEDRVMIDLALAPYDPRLDAVLKQISVLVSLDTKHCAAELARLPLVVTG